MNKTSIFSTLSLMHKAMLFGQIIFIALFFYLVYSQTMLPTIKNQQKLMQSIALGITVVFLFTANKLFKLRIEKIHTQSLVDSREKLHLYRKASIVKWALVEIPCLLCGIFMLLSADYAYLGLAILLIIYFAMFAPTKAKVAAELNMNAEDLEML